MRWRKLEESKVRQDDIEPEVFRILRFSYTHLKDSALQKCVFNCSLFPEDFEVDRNT
jgi:disease resistance protein RPS2